MDEFIGKLLLSTLFQVGGHFARLFLCYYLSHGNNTYKLLAGRFKFYCHTTIILL
jgi:hypothetical protein